VNPEASYQIDLRRAAQKQLDKLIGRDYHVVAEAISALAKQPRPQNVEKLAESGLFRIRIRAFRIVYSIDDKERLVTVVKVARRSEDTYRRL